MAVQNPLPDEKLPILEEDMIINKTEVVENIKVKCTFDKAYGATSSYFYIESILTGEILLVGSGNCNDEMSEEAMTKYAITKAIDFIRSSRYQDHINMNMGKLEKAIKIIGDIGSSDSNFKQACLFLEEIKNE